MESRDMSYLFRGFLARSTQSHFGQMELCFLSYQPARCPHDNGLFLSVSREVGLPDKYWIPVKSEFQRNSHFLAQVCPKNCMEYTYFYLFMWASLVAHTVKTPPAMLGDLGLIPGSGRSPGEENSNPLQYSCLEKSMDRGAWQTTVHRVEKSQA